jgi:predicted transcriptional regulator
MHIPKIFLTHFSYSLVGLSVLTVHKFYNDNFYSNKNVFGVLGIDHHEFSSLEKDFLDVLDFQIVVSENDYQDCLAGLDSFFQDKNHSIIEEAEQFIES